MSRKNEQQLRRKFLGSKGAAFYLKVLFQNRGLAPIASKLYFVELLILTGMKNLRKLLSEWRFSSVTFCSIAYKMRFWTTFHNYIQSAFVWERATYLCIFAKDYLIFTLAIRWAYFGSTRFVHRWTTIVHVTLSVSDVTDKWISWLTGVTLMDVTSWRWLLKVITSFSSPLI